MKDHLFDTDEAGYTALHWATQEGQLAMVEYLVMSCGFAVKAVDKVCLLYWLLVWTYLLHGHGRHAHLCLGCVILSVVCVGHVLHAKECFYSPIYISFWCTVEPVYNGHCIRQPPLYNSHPTWPQIALRQCSLPLHCSAPSIQASYDCTTGGCCTYVSLYCNKTPVLEHCLHMYTS